MNLSETIKRILREELNTDSTKFERQSKVIKKILDSASYEGVCGYVFTIDEDNDRVASVILKFSEEWYWSSVESPELSKKMRLIGLTKIEIGEIINRYLNIEDLYVGSYLDKCD
jgi:hypothetical protein